MSGNYPPPGGDPNPYGQQEPYGQQDPYRQPGPYGQQSPYEQQQQYGQPGYPSQHGRPDFMPAEQAYYAQQTWGEGYYGAPGWEPPDKQVQTNAIVVLVVSIATFTCCSNVFAIGGIVCGIIALTRWEQQPESARNLNKWAWICTGGGMILGLLLVIAYVVLMVSLGTAGAL